MPKVSPTKAFLRDLKRLGSQTRQSDAIEALAEFAGNPRHTGLNFEKIIGRPDYFTIRTNLADRILLKKDDVEDSYAAVAIGNHDYIYRGFFKNR